MSHADALRAWAKQYNTHTACAQFLAGADALDTLDRVRAVLTDLRGQQEAALQRWDDTGDTWYGATADALEYVIDLLTEALEGETE